MENDKYLSHTRHYVGKSFFIIIKMKQRTRHVVVHMIEKGIDFESTSAY